MTDELESRLIDLEIKLGFQEDLINSFNAIIIDQQFQLEALQKQLRHLYQNLPAKPQVLDFPLDEKPPHY